jgi:predicted acylesterase/phospholipase RssA
VALSGGGFRATFFHLGVLRRLAELDLLRHVSVLSTVSGGSILGACYILHLKHRFESSWGALTRRDYEETVDATEATLRRGVRKNLRTRLLMAPWWNLRMLCTDFSWGRRMARLYQRHLFRDAARRIAPVWADGVPLQDLKFRPPGKGVGFDVEQHNREAAGRAEPTLVPKWVINATSLNTGRDFRFTMSEIGDPELGSIRFDEVGTIIAYKRLLETARRRASAGAEWFPDMVTQTRNRYSTEDEPWIRRIEAASTRRPVQAPSEAYPFRTFTAAHLYWWVAARAGAPWKGVSSRGALPATVFALEEHGTALLRTLAESAIGLLRDAKLAAWYLRDGLTREPPVSGGYSREDHVDRLWGALRRMQDGLGALRTRFTGAALDDLAELILDVYYFRSAEQFGWASARELERLTLADAVAASANFPPVFNPFTVHDLYDPAAAHRVALTDGGVYDNLGLSALLEEECTHLIVSDAGGTLAVERRPSNGRVSMLARIGEVLMADVRDRQLREVGQRRRPVARVPAATFFEMASDPSAAVPPGPKPPEPHPEARSIAQLRTDLDAFSPIEIDALTYQGYQLADRYVRTNLGLPFLPAPQSAPPPKAITAPETASAPAIAAALRVGHRRLFRSVALVRPLRWLLIALAVAGLAMLATRDLSIDEVTRRLVAGLHYVFTHPFLDRDWHIEWSWPKGVVVALLVGLAGGAIWLRWPRLEAGLAGLLARRRRGNLGSRVWAHRVARAVGQWRWNLWWPVGLAPLWTALGVAAAATVSFCLDLIPVRRK